MSEDFEGEPGGEREQEEDWEALADAVELPQWLLEALPVLPEEYKISWDEENSVSYLRKESGEVVYTAGSLEEVYDHARELALNFSFDSAVSFQQLSLPADERGFSRFLVASSDQSELRLLKTHYRNWLETYREWQANPGDWAASFVMVDSHPAFWRAHYRPSKQWVNAAGERATLAWKCQGLSREFWVFVDRKPTGDNLVMVECGGHVPPLYDSTYHDLRLDVYAPTLEAAFVQLAALVDKFFHPDGSEREGVEYEKSELELHLEAAVADLEARGVTLGSELPPEAGGDAGRA